MEVTIPTNWSRDILNIQNFPFVHKITPVTFSRFNEWIVEIKGEGAYEGFTHKILINLSTELVKSLRIIDHPGVNDDGYFQREFYMNLLHHDLQDFIYNACEWLKIENHAPTLKHEQLSEENTIFAWKQHSEQCICSVFPLPFSKLMTLPESEIKVYIKNTRNKLLQINLNRFNQTIEYIKTRINILNNYVPLHKNLFNFNLGWDTWFDPLFLTSFNSSSSDHKYLLDIMVEETENVFSFPMFNIEFCDKLVEEVNNFEISTFPKQRPNSMNNYGLILNNIGMEGMFDILVTRYIKTLSNILFPHFIPGKEIDHHHSFIVEYKIGADLKLDMHTDDSEVTLNVNLFDKFEGAGLSFCGMNATKNLRKHSLTYQHVKGRAIIHLGRHRHGADSITNGKRLNLIVWCRSSQYRHSTSLELIRNDFEERPDKICLSKTHDPDYNDWKYS